MTLSSRIAFIIWRQKPGTVRTVLHQHCRRRTLELLATDMSADWRNVLSPGATFIRPSVPYARSTGVHRRALALCTLPTTIVYI